MSDRDIIKPIIDNMNKHNIDDRVMFIENWKIKFTKYSPDADEEYALAVIDGNGGKN